MIRVSMLNFLNPLVLTPKLFWPIFCLFLKFGQPILVRVLMLNF